MTAAPQSSPEHLHASTVTAWNRWQEVVDGRAHIGFQMFDDDLGRHIEEALRQERATVARIAATWGRPEAPRRILDIGCSAGLKMLALQQHWPGTHVDGIDPDREAVAAGRQLAGDPWVLSRVQADLRPELVEASAESLPYPDGSFDLVTCITVIEHVRDVDRAIAEIARVLAPGGVALIEAPNYLWPIESHLHVVVPPLGPKWLMRWCARLQGQAAHAGFVDHLQLVHPAMMERLFRAHGLAFSNEALAKLAAAAAGDTSGVIAYAKTARLLAGLRRVGLAAPLVAVIGAIGMYPSLLYRLHKRQDS